MSPAPSSRRRYGRPIMGLADDFRRRLWEQTFTNPAVDRAREEGGAEFLPSELAGWLVGRMNVLEELLVELAERVDELSDRAV